VIKEDYDSGKADKSHVQQIEHAANRAAELCRQMLAYAGKSPLLKVQIDVRLLVDDMVNMLASAIKKNVSIQLDLQHDVPVIFGDNAQLQQVVMNLLINAAEAIGDNNGTITVTLKNSVIQTDQPVTDVTGSEILAGKYVCLEVADTGCGIDEETEKRIFEPFFTTKFAGRGLGMSAVLGIIKSHAGAVELSSTPGVGSTFRVYLPLPHVQEQIPEIQKHSVDNDAARPHLKVLLVDDEDTLRNMEIALLNIIGFSAVTAANGREAIDLYKTRTSEIDLVILDLVLPEMDGVKTYYELRKINQTVPVLICSGYSAELVTDVIANDDKAAFLNKPYKPTELRRVLDTIVDA
jgi:CheY-like chemotaxis protein